MKPYEIFKAAEVFKTVMAGTEVPQALKLAIAQEFKHTLPPVSFSAGCVVTRRWLEDTVQATIDVLKAEEDANTKATEAIALKGKHTHKEAKVVQK